MRKIVLQVEALLRVAESFSSLPWMYSATM